MGSNCQVTRPQPRIASFVVLDLETSNLPAFNFNRAGITELCMYGVAADTLGAANENSTSSGEFEALPAPIPKFPRVVHKLTLMLNPRMLVHPESERITGLNNFILENEHSFDENAAITVQRFLKHLQQPVCLVAHNGWNFDFPLVKQAFDKLNMHLPENTLCLDSLQALWKIDKQRAIVKPHILMTISPVPTPPIKVEIGESATTTVTDDVVIDWRLLNETTPKRPTNCTEAPVTGNKYTKRLKIETEREVGAGYKNQVAQQVVEENAVKSRRALFVSNISSNEQASDASHASSSTNSGVRMYVNCNRTWTNGNRRRNYREYPPKNIYKLGNIYARIFGKPMSQSHYAEADVAALLKLMLHYGADFLKYAEQNAIPFAEVRKVGASTN